MLNPCYCIRPSMQKIPIVHIGLGPLGIKLLELMAERKTAFQLCAAVDINPEIKGKSVSDLTGRAEYSGVVVSGDIPSAASCRDSPDPVAILTTVSTLAAISPQITACLNAGYHVVSTCEELAFPSHQNLKLSHAIDETAKQNGRAVLGTGVNPGFMMDFLPQALTAVSHRVDRVVVERFQDASLRRLPFQKKVGGGLSVEEFAKRKKDGSLRHVGLEESMHLIAAQFGWELERTEDMIEPVVAQDDFQNSQTVIPAGHCLGVSQTGRGYRMGREVITLHFKASLGLPNPFDRIVIEGEPRIESVILGGISGDIATCSIALNACRTIRKLSPGLKTMGEIPAISWFE